MPQVGKIINMQLINEKNNILLIFSAKFLRLAGYTIICFAFLCNPWVLGKLLAADGKIDQNSLVLKIIFFELIFIISGLVVIKKSTKEHILAIKKQKFLFIAMLCIVTIICFSVSEVFFRFVQPYEMPEFVNLSGHVYSLKGLTQPYHFTYDPIAGYSLIPDIKDQNQEIITDRYGFRSTGKPFNPEQESIIFVGDSTVFGWGVNDKAAFPYLIARNKLLDNLNVINMGVPSYSIGHITAVLKYKVPKFKPRIVFVAILWPWKPFSAYSTKDAWKNIDYEFYKRTIPLRAEFKPQLPLWHYLVPKTFYVIRDYYYRIRYKDEFNKNLTRPGIRDFSISAEDEIKLSEEHIKLLQEAANPLIKNGVKVIFYIHPYQYTVFHKKYQHLGETGCELMIKKLNALYPRDFLLREFTNEPFFIDGSHLNESGHKVYAKYFLEIIKSELNLRK